MIRKTPLRRSSRPIRRHPGRSRFPKRRCEPYLEWLKEQQCGVTGLVTGDLIILGKGIGQPTEHIRIVVDPMHIRARGAAGNDLWNALPMAHHLHEESHRIGIKSFAKKYGVDLKVIAVEHTERFLAGHPEHRPEVRHE